MRSLVGAVYWITVICRAASNVCLSGIAHDQHVGPVGAYEGTTDL